jgi:SHS2 domain-containing protein
MDASETSSGKPTPASHGQARRSHAALSHTADAGIRARAGDLAGLLEEGAAALAELMADLPPTVPSAAAVPIEVHADDLVGLAYAWLSELVGLADARGEALVQVTVDELQDSDGAWTARATARFVPYDEGVQPRAQVKAATYHRLSVEAANGGWSLAAYFDL